MPTTHTTNPFAAIADLLNETVTAVGPKLRALSEADVSTPPASGKWSRKQILGHLIDSAANNHQRFVRTQLLGQYNCLGYEQEGWVCVEDPQSAPWAVLVDLWTSYNRYLAHLLARIPAEAAPAPITIKDTAVTLQFVAQDYLRHLKQHLGQIGV
jgi:hypothetical protein